jgi:alkaline phosphatase D
MAGRAGANFPLERQKLCDTIRNSGAKGVVFVSGDRHIGALYREQPAGLHPLYEMTSSGLNMVYWAAREAGPNRLGALYAAASFGVVDIDWWERKVVLALRVDGGNTRRSGTVDFATIGLG